MENIGMMEGAFFVSRSDIINWINNTLKMNLSKIEQTASGSVALQMMDIMQPGKVPVSKVKWAATQEQEFIHNQKILQHSFDKANIKKWIDVDKLVKAKYQDNLEFMQWLKAYYDRINPDLTSYDPVARRKGAKTIGDTNKDTNKSLSFVGEKEKDKERERGKTMVEKEKKDNLSKHSVKNETPRQLKDKDSKNTNSKENLPVKSKGEVDKMKAELEKSKTVISDLKDQLIQSNKERDFQFDKLRLVEEQIEQVEQQVEDEEGLASRGFKTIMRILMATGDENLSVDKADLQIDEEKFNFKDELNPENQ